MNILLNGYSGKMGQAIAQILPEDDHIVAKINRDFSENLSQDIDVAIDFSAPKGTMKLLPAVIDRHIPTIIGTTGLNEQQQKEIAFAAEKIKILYSSNFSIGVNVLHQLVKLAARLLPKEFQIEIVEKHHCHKKDAPSGTAKQLFQTIQEIRLASYPLYGRHGHSEERSNDEIGIHSLRCGEIFGEHEILFEGMQEEISLQHRAFDRKIFARGALIAAHWLIKNPAESGLFTMDAFLGF